MDGSIQLSSLDADAGLKDSKLVHASQGAVHCNPPICDASGELAEGKLGTCCAVKAHVKSVSWCISPGRLLGHLRADELVLSLAVVQVVLLVWKAFALC